MDNFYRDNILDHYKNPRNFGRLKKPDVSYSEENVTCGDKIGMELKFKVQNSKFKIIEDVRFWGEGCAVSMASSSLLTQKVKGMDVLRVKNLGKEDILKLLGIELTPTRLKCALLPLEVLQKALQGE